jgi:hypothetical protein
VDQRSASSDLRGLLLDCWASPLQNSVLGMLRTIFHQAVSRFPGLLTDPTLRDAIGRRGIYNSAWATDALLKAVHTVAVQAGLCLFVDGLDECEGSLKRLQDLEQILSDSGKLPNVKVCALGRPWPVFESAYSTLETQIMLHKLTEDNIVCFVIDSLRATDPVTLAQHVSNDDMSEFFET